MLKDHDAERRNESSLDSSYPGSNQSWIEQLYEDLTEVPDSADANWRPRSVEATSSRHRVKPITAPKTRDYFPSTGEGCSRYTSSISDPDTNVKQVKVLQLINAYRFRGATSMRISIRWGLWKQREAADLDPALPMI